MLLLYAREESWWIVFSIEANNCQWCLRNYAFNLWNVHTICKCKISKLFFKNHDIRPLKANVWARICKIIFKVKLCKKSSFISWDSFFFTIQKGVRNRSGIIKHLPVSFSQSTCLRINYFSIENWWAEISFLFRQNAGRRVEVYWNFCIFWNFY